MSGASSQRPDTVNSCAAAGPAAVRAAVSFTPVTSRPANSNPKGPARSTHGDRSLSRAAGVSHGDVAAARAGVSCHAHTPSAALRRRYGASRVRTAGETPPTSPLPSPSGGRKGPTNLSRPPDGGLQQARLRIHLWGSDTARWEWRRSGWPLPCRSSRGRTVSVNAPWPSSATPSTYSCSWSIRMVVAGRQYNRAVAGRQCQRGIIGGDF